MNKYIEREPALSFPFANGRYDEENANIDFICGCETYKEYLETLPCVEVREWIPVTERLPDELTEVNITWINTNPAPCYEFIKGKPNTGSAVYCKGKWYWYSAVCADYLAEYGFSPNDDMDDAIKVIAWMPLPKPFEVKK